MQRAVDQYRLPVRSGGSPRILVPGIVMMILAAIVTFFVVVAGSGAFSSYSYLFLLPWIMGLAIVMAVPSAILYYQGKFSLADPVIFATWSYLFPFSSVQWVRDMEKCLRGEKVSPTRTQIGRIVTLENLDEVKTMVSNPLDPSVQKFYADPAVMKFSDEQLTTPK